MWWVKYRCCVAVAILKKFQDCIKQCDNIFNIDKIELFWKKYQKPISVLFKNTKRFKGSKQKDVNILEIE